MCLKNTVKKVLKDVSAKHNLQPIDLLSKGRFRHIVVARNEAIATLVDKYGYGFAEIARQLNIHHATAIRSYGSHHKATGVSSKWADIYDQRIRYYRESKKNERPAKG